MGQVNRALLAGRIVASVFLGCSALAMARFALIAFARRRISRSRALGLRKISEVCYLRNPKNLVLCALLMGMSISMLACGYSGTPPGDKLPANGNAPVITQQPASQTVIAGQAATFLVMATGTAPLSYQWYVNSAAAGTDSSSFTIAAATVGQTGAHIYVTVTDAVGSATSATVTLTVNAPATAPAITQ